MRSSAWIGEVRKTVIELTTRNANTSPTMRGTVEVSTIAQLASEAAVSSMRPVMAACPTSSTAGTVVDHDDADAGTEREEDPARARDCGR